MKRTFAALATTGLLGLLGLSGCGNTDTPAAHADPATSAAPPTRVTPSHTGPTPPALPAVAAKPTRAGAIAFAKYYWKVVDYAQRTGDTRLLRGLQYKTCKACVGGIRWIDRVRRAGGTIRGGTYALQSARAQQAPGSPKSPAYAVVIKATTTAQQVSGAGRLDHQYPPSQPSITMSLQFMGGKWSVTSWDMH